MDKLHACDDCGVINETVIYAENHQNDPQPKCIEILIVEAAEQRGYAKALSDALGVMDAAILKYRQEYGSYDPDIDCWTMPQDEERDVDCYFYMRRLITNLVHKNGALS